ncbi:hypothetical protein V8J08_005112 [Citrobacter amalonaticus]
MSNIDKQALRQTAEKAQEHGVFNMDIHSQTVLALLDELEAAKQDSAKWFKAFEKSVSVGARYEERIAEQQRSLDHREFLLLSADQVQREYAEALGCAGDNESILEAIDDMKKRIAELEALGCGVKQFSEFQICHYGATEDYAKGYIDCQNNYNKVLFAAAGKGA